MGELRERKKRDTRQRLSDAATRLFFARGFDAVTVEEIAAAADVSKVTVFNYFTRKEDLLFDREWEVKPLLHAALAQRQRGESAIDAIRSLVGRLREQEHPFACVGSRTVAFFRVVAASPSLIARLREIEDEVALGLATELGGPEPDALARLAAGMVVLTWHTAYAEALRVFERSKSAKKANAAFIALIDTGFAAIAGLGASGRAGLSRAR